MSTLKDKALKGIKWSLLDKILNQAGSFVLLIYLSRVLSPSDFGMIALLTIFIAIAQSMVDSGLGQALVQKSENVTENDLSTIFYSNIILSIFIYLLLYNLSPVISAFYDIPELTNISRIAFLVIIVNSFSIVPKAILTIKIDFKKQSIANTVATIVSGIFAVWMVVNQFGYWALVWMNIVKSATIVITLFILSSWKPKLKFSIGAFRRLFSFGSKLLVAGILATTVQNLYTAILGRRFTSDVVGHYQQANNYTNLLSNTVTSIVQGVTYPIMTSIQGDKNRLIKIYSKSMGLVVFVTFPIFFGFMAIAEEFVEIFLGDKWLPIVPILIILSCARVITPISALNLNILNAQGRSDLFLKSDLIKLPIFIGALLISLPYGIQYVALAQVTSVFFSFFINAYYPGKLFGFGWYEQIKLIFPIFVSSLIMYIAIIPITLDCLITQLLVKMVVGGVIYFICCYVLKAPPMVYLLEQVSIKYRSGNSN